MPLSRKRRGRDPVRARAVGLPLRLLASGLDGLLPSLGLIIMIRTGALRLDFLQPRPGLLDLDRVLLSLYRDPHGALSAPLTWMLIWTAVSLVCLGTVRTTFGKWLVGLELRQKNGAIASGARLLLRIAVSWLVPLTFGLAYLWVAVSPDRRGWHDLLSGTYVVKRSQKSKVGSQKWR